MARKKNAKNQKKIKAEVKAVVKKAVKATKKKRTRSKKSGGGGGSISAAVRKTTGNYHMTVGSSRIRITGSDFMGPYTAGATTTEAGVLYKVFINPNTILAGTANNSRLARFSQLYEKFRFKKLCVRYVPSVGTTTAGTLFMAADNDPEDDFGNFLGTQLIARARACKYSTWFSVYEEACLNITGNEFFSSELYCDPDRDGDRWGYAGIVYIGNVGAVANAVTYGWLDISYELEFSSPALEVSTLGSGTAGFKSTTTDVSHTHVWGSAWNGVTGVTSWSNVDCNIVGTVPGTTTSQSAMVFNVPGVYAVTWYHTGSALTSTAVTFFGGATAWNASLSSWTESTTTKENGMIVVNVPAQNGGVTATAKALGPTYTSLKMYVFQLPVAPFPAVLPLTVNETKKALQLRRLLEGLALRDGAPKGKEPVPEEADVVEDVSLEVETTGTLQTPGNPSESYSSTSTITGTIIGPDPAAKAKLVKNLIQKYFGDDPQELTSVVNNLQL